MVRISTKALNNRLRALESLYKRDRIIVLGCLPDGTERPMTVGEMTDMNAGFCKVLDGSDLIDFDLILECIVKQSVVDRKK